MREIFELRVTERRKGLRGVVERVCLGPVSDVRHAHIVVGPENIGPRKRQIIQTADKRGYWVEIEVYKTSGDN